MIIPLIEKYKMRGSVVVDQPLRTVAGYYQDVRVQRRQLRLRDRRFAGHAVQSLGFVLVVGQVYVGVQVQEVQVRRPDSLFLLLLHLREVPLYRLVLHLHVRPSCPVLSLLVPPQLLLYLHLDLFEQSHLSLLRQTFALLPSDARSVEPITCEGAVAADEGSAVGQMVRRVADHFGQLLLHLSIR